MITSKITSKENPKYKLWSKLAQKKYRLKEQLLLVEGEHLVIEAQKAGLIVDVLVCEGVIFNIDAQVTTLAKSLFEKLAQTVTSAGIMAVCQLPTKQITQCNRLLLVDDVKDPGNLGTLIRSALAFGFDGLVTSVATVDFYNEKVVRATQGAIFKLPICQENLLDYIPKLQKAGVLVYAATLHQEALPMEAIPVAKKLAFVVGNEGRGVSESVVQACDKAVVIKMASSVESLNVGVAGSLLMYNFNGFKVQT